MKEEIETEIYNGWEVPCLLEKSEVVIVGRKALLFYVFAALGLGVMFGVLISMGF